MRLVHWITFALAWLVRPAAAEAQAPDSVLPSFRATEVRVMHDTAWFFGTFPAERATRHPLVGFVPASGEWITVRRRWRAIDTLANLRERSGPVDTHPRSIQRIGLGFRVADRREWSENDSVARFALVAPNGRQLVPRISLPAAVRRELYRRGGGHPTQRAPVFEREPAWWAASKGRVVLAFEGIRPPSREWYWTQIADRGQWRYPVRMSGLLVIDSATLKTTSLAHPRLIERGWVGTELVGRSLFVVPDSLNDARYESHAAASTPTPRLARYDFVTGRWKIFGSGELPTADAPVVSMAADDRFVYLATVTGLAALDTRSMRWSARFYADSEVVVADGADSAITVLRRSPPAVAAMDSNGDADSLAVTSVLATRLGVRHRSRLERLMLQLLPFDTLASLSAFIEHVEARADELGDIDTPFGPQNAMMAGYLARPEFEPYLREAARSTVAQDYALGVLRLLGDDRVVSALRSALDSGSAPAAIVAADSLLRRGDSTALVWLRRQIAEAPQPLDYEPAPSMAYTWPLEQVATLLAIHDDTASIPSLIALLRPPDSGIAERAQSALVRALVAFPSPGAQEQIAKAVAQRPWLQQLYSSIRPRLPGGSARP